MASSLVHLHHGSVRMVAGLARVDLTLEVQNTGQLPMEWRRRYAIDPSAELTGAVLRRVNEDAIMARTLTLANARGIYAQIRVPPTTRPGDNRDPLLIERPRSDQLDVRIWPIEPQETVRVELTFVTPLRGHGAHRTYVDVMGGPRPDAPPAPAPGRGPAPEQPAPEPPPPDVLAAAGGADWLMNPGRMVLSSAPAFGMTLSGEAGGLLHFTGPAATEAHTPRPNVDFLTADKGGEALLVGHGSYMGRVATWRFDPSAFLTRKGFDLREDLELRLRPVKGKSRRLAPNVFHASSDPLPVTTLLVSRTLKSVPYVVDVLDRHGHRIVTYTEELPLRTEKVGAGLEAAISGWHRAMLVRRVFAWAHGDAERRDEAMRYAVDLGVLVPGTGALAVPASERRRLTQRNRRIYDTEGVPLGAPRHEADLEQPPKGSLR
jgi:hypothetical protein